MRQIQGRIWQPHFWQTRSYLTHAKFLTNMHRLGYPRNAGVCHGLSCVAAQYFLSQKMAQLDNNLFFLAHHVDYIDRQPEEICHFLDAIQVTQHPEEFPILSSRSHVQFQSAQKALSLLNVRSLDHFGGVYSVEELAQLFTILRNRITSVLDCALLVNALHHAVMVAFDRKRFLWCMVDSENLPIRLFENETTLAIALNRAVSCSNNPTVCSMRIAVNEKNLSGAKKIINHYRQNDHWQSLQAVIKKRETLTNHLGTTWLMLASRENFYHDVQSLIHCGAKIDQENKCNFTALGYAVHYRNDSIVRLLLENGAKASDKDNSYLQAAARFGYYGIAKMLIQAGASVNDGRPSPVILAAQNKHRKLLTLFSEYSDIEAGRCFIPDNHQPGFKP